MALALVSRPCLPAAHRLRSPFQLCLQSSPQPLPSGEGGGGAGLGWAELFHGWYSPPCPAGTSSILAGAALAALQRAAGRAVGTEALIHAVLHLEQVLTTGMACPRAEGGHWNFFRGLQGLPWTCRQNCAAPYNG